MARPIILGVVGDSAAGKTTISKGLVEILGEENVTHIGTDDYHRYDREQRAEHGITPLDPDCNYIDIMAQHVGHLRNGEPILKPVYGHGNGTFGRPEYIVPKRFAVIEGLLGYHTQELCDAHDVRVFLAPPGGAAPRVEDQARHEQARLQRGAGPRGARQARAGLRGVHPPAAPPRRHDRLLPARRRQREARRRADPVRGPPPPGHVGAARRGRQGGSSSRRTRSARAACSSPATSIPTAAPRSRRASGRRCSSPSSCAPSASASSRVGDERTAPSRWRSCRC